MWNCLNNDGRGRDRPHDITQKFKVLGASTGRSSALCESHDQLVNSGRYNDNSDICIGYVHNTLVRGNPGTL